MTTAIRISTATVYELLDGLFDSAMQHINATRYRGDAKERQGTKVLC